MPQIAQIAEILASQLFWLTITFGIIFFGIGLGMLPKIQSTVDARDKRISSDLERAEKAREEADKLEEDYRAAMDKARGESARAVAEAKADAARQSEARMAEVDTKLDAQLVEAQQRIARSREAAIAELEAVAADATRQIVERLTGVEVAPAVAQEAVKGELVRG